MQSKGDARISILSGSQYVLILHTIAHLYERSWAFKLYRCLWDKPLSLCRRRWKKHCADSTWGADQAELVALPDVKHRCLKHYRKTFPVVVSSWSLSICRERLPWGCLPARGWYKGWRCKKILSKDTAVMRSPSWRLLSFSSLKTSLSLGLASLFFLHRSPGHLEIPLFLLTAKKSFPLPPSAQESLQADVSWQYFHYAVLSSICWADNNQPSVPGHKSLGVSSS